MRIAELKKEYAEQGNRGTAYPIYVMVQEQVSIGVMAEGYSVNCPYGDGETKTEYMCNQESGDPDICDTREEAIGLLEEELKGKELQEAIDNIDEFNVGYIWHPVEFFLTIKGAEEYMRANKHNHGKLRTYVGYFERRNFEMRALLSELGFKTKE